MQDAPLVAAMQAELPARPDGADRPGSRWPAPASRPRAWWPATGGTPSTRPDGTVAIVVADVSGHGPEASVTAVRVRSIMRAALQAGLAPDAVMAMAAELVRRTTRTSSPASSS